MTKRTSIVQQLGTYFASKGGTMTAEEYKVQEDAPVRFQVVKRAIGSWSRVLNMIGDLSQYDGTAKQEVITKVEEIPTPSAPEPEAKEPEVVKEVKKPATKG